MKKILTVSTITLLMVIFLAGLVFSVAKADALEDCIKNYQSQGVSYDNAKAKCYALIQNQTSGSVQNMGTIQSQTSPVPTTNQGIIDPSCISKYISDFNLTYDQAKQKCYGLLPTTQTTPVPQPKPMPPISDDCIKNYINQTGGTYEDAKIKCAPITPYIQPINPIQVNQTQFEACVQKYLNSGYSAEEAKKVCIQQFPVPTSGVAPQVRQIGQQVAPIEICIKKYMEVFGISAEDAKIKCASPVIAPTAAVKVEIKEQTGCSVLAKRLAELTQKLQSVQGDDAIKITQEIQKIKQELLKCQPPTITDKCLEIRKNIYNLELQLKDAKTEQEIQKIKNTIENQRKNLENCAKQNTPGVKNPCDEIPNIKTALENMIKKQTQIKELVDKGELDKTALEDAQRHIEFIKKQMEQMQFACQQGNKATEESPCAKLARLGMIYNQNQDSSLVKEITGLKELCRAQGLSQEKVGNLAGVEEAYKAKLNAVVEGTFGQDQVDQLKKAEEDKNNLVSGIVAGAKELDMRGITVVGKINIKSGEMVMNKFKINSVPLKIEVNGKEVNINPSNNGFKIEEGGASVDSNAEIDYQNGTLVGTNSGKSINVLPSELKDKITGNIISSEFQDQTSPTYNVKVEAKGKLLGFIPISAAKNFVVDAQTGATQESAPWWKFFVKY